ncbi:MAG: hypothetical protein C4321_03865 [Chloroflexota bacterium]
MSAHWFSPKARTPSSSSCPFIADTTIEDNETVNVRLSNPKGATLGKQDTAILVIADDDDPGLLEIEGWPSIPERFDTLSVRISRYGRTSGEVSVHYATGDGTAVAGCDYVATSRTVTFADGEEYKDITIPLLPDNLVENNETFRLVLSSPTGGAILGSGRSVTVTILDDDSHGTFGLALSPWHYQQAFEGEPFARVLVVRGDGACGRATVDFATSDSSATAGQDYTPVSMPLEFEAGEQFKEIHIPLNDDHIVEPNEAIRVTLSRPTGGAQLHSNKDGYVIVYDNDETGLVAFRTAAVDVDENTVTVTLTG